jgi:2-polyprenyl-3-methyl-5-hydroxy-6-metoxy-1,4-benzoquinol methylase
MESTMFESLQQINARPAPFEHITTAELWTDEHTSARMLAFHLDGSVNVASRKTAIIDRSVGWMVSRFGLDESSRVADLGCGPGLYTTRLAAAGCNVTGIDFSSRSIRHAEKLARRRGVTVNHVQADYLQYETSERFDLITMIMCDFCALGPSQRQTLLDKVMTLLEPGGAFLFDVYSLLAFAAREENASYARDLMDGFWSPEPYFGFVSTFKYEAEKVVLDKYTIVEATRSRVIYNWLQHYDPETIRLEVEGRGLCVEEILGDVAGAPFDPEAHEFAIVATEPGAPGT